MAETSVSSLAGTNAETGRVRILFLESSPADAEQCVRELRKAGIELDATVVQKREDFAARLKAGWYDIILSEYNLPGWNALEALEYLRQNGPDIPFLLVTGYLTEEGTDACIRKGIADYVRKDRLAGLPHAVRRALQGKALGKVRNLYLNILMVEDNPEDVDLLLRELRRAGIEAHSDIAQTPERFAAVIRSRPWDVVLADYRLPGWNGLEVLEILREQGRDIPVILVTGTLGDELAADCIREGCADYVLKDRLARLPSAVRRALGEKALQEERGRAIAERKRLEQQLFLAQRLEAIGRLAGGIAHDFNNLLGVVTGFSDLVLDGLEPESPLRPPLEEVRKAGERGISLTRQLLAFSRQQVLEPKVVSLNHIVSDTVKMLQHVLGEDIVMTTLLSPQLGSVKADPAQIEQVLLNLAVNARDAMPTGGKLTIETSNIYLDEAYVHRHVVGQPGPYVLLAVSDTGKGMDAETQAHAFEPFFTTKEKGKGTGLGLATVYGIVKQSGGYIWLYSEPEKGTAFKIYLPRVDEAATRERVRERTSQAPAGMETVLLLEDEPALRELVQQWLVGLGYVVLEAQGGVEALEISKNYNGPIHLLLTDVVMPGMSGRDLAERIVPSRPEMKVLYISGYTNDAIVRHGVLQPGVVFLQKPFTRQSLANKVRETLDAAAEA